MSHAQLQPALAVTPRVTTPDSWWEVSEGDSVRHLELTPRAQHALDNTYRVGDILDLDFEMLPGSARAGARTKEQLALLRENPPIHESSRIHRLDDGNLDGLAKDKTPVPQGMRLSPSHSSFRRKPESSHPSSS